MVNLTREQVKEVEKLSAVKADYDRRIADLDVQYANAREGFKQRVRQQVAEAEAAGVPMRRIHLALGFAQQNQLTNFLRPTKGATVGTTSTLDINSSGLTQGGNQEPRPVDTRAETVVRSGGQPVQVEQPMYNILRITDTFGKEWARAITVSVTDDKIVVGPVNPAWHGPMLDRNEIIVAVNDFLSEKNPGLDIEWLGLDKFDN